MDQPRFRQISNIARKILQRQDKTEFDFSECKRTGQRIVEQKPYPRRVQSLTIASVSNARFIAKVLNTHHQVLVERYMLEVGH